MNILYPTFYLCCWLSK